MKSCSGVASSTPQSQKCSFEVFVCGRSCFEHILCATECVIERLNEEQVFAQDALPDHYPISNSFDSSHEHINNYWLRSWDVLQSLVRVSGIRTNAQSFQSVKYEIWWRFRLSTLSTNLPVFASCLGTPEMELMISSFHVCPGQNGSMQPRQLW